MKIKRILSLFIAVAILFTLAGCSKSGNSSSPTNDTPSKIVVENEIEFDITNQEKLMKWQFMK